MAHRLTYYDAVDDLWKGMPVPEAPDGSTRAVAAFLTRIIRDTYEGMSAVALKRMTDGTDKLSVHLEYPFSQGAPRFCIVELEIGPQDRMHIFVDQAHQVTVPLTQGVPRQDSVVEELINILSMHIDSHDTVELVMQIHSERGNVGLERSIVRNAWHRQRLRVRVTSSS